MYAIVEIAGQQFKVAKDQKVFVHRLDAKEGDKVQFDNVLLIDNNGSVNIGAPAIEGAAVKASVARHLKGDKVIVFKKKRRKGYKVKNGHRQSLTEITIEEILEKGAKSTTAKKAAPKKAAPKKEAPKKEEPKAEEPVEEAPAAAVEAAPEAAEEPKAEATEKEAPAADAADAEAPSADATDAEEDKKAE